MEKKGKCPITQSEFEVIYPGFDVSNIKTLPLEMYDGLGEKILSCASCAFPDNKCRGAYIKVGGGADF